MPSSWWPAFEREVLRINRRYNLEIIEALGVCPYARGARGSGASTVLVLPVEEASVEALLAVVEALEPQGEIEVAQVVMPLAVGAPAAFSEVAARFGEANAKRHGGKRPVFVHAAFHPQLTYYTDTPARLVPFFRRSPDPMVQLVRLSVLDSIHANRPRGTQFFDGDPSEFLRLLRARPESITDRITRENHERALAGELAQIEGLMAEIHADRAASYHPFLDSAARREVAG